MTDHEIKERKTLLEMQARIVELEAKVGKLLSEIESMTILRVSE